MQEFKKWLGAIGGGAISAALLSIQSGASAATPATFHVSDPSIAALVAVAIAAAIRGLNWLVSKVGA